MDKNNVREFEIPVPWGQIAVKTQGNEKNPLVLLMHGIMDNLGSYELLLPFLRNDYYYVSIDLPGHGKSSPFPPHVPIQLEKFIFMTKLIMDYLKRDKYIIIGHSWSGHLAMVYALLYPKQILKLIILDVIFPYGLSIEYFKQFYRDRMDYLSKMYKRCQSNAQSIYSYREAFNKLQTNRMYGEITKEATQALSERCLISLGNGKFKYSTDFRVRLFYGTMFGRESMIDLIKKYPIICPVVFILAKDSPPSISYFKLFLKELYKNNTQCFVRTVDGSHDVHMNNPKIVAPIINAFLIYGNSKL